MGRTVTLTLHRNDLRIHDNALLHHPHASPESEGVTHVLPLYVFDERFIELGQLPDYQRQGPEARTRLCGFWRTSAFRARFLCEGVYDLQKNLQHRGSDLLIRFGKMDEVCAQIAKALKDNGDEVREVLLQEEFYSEEKAIERKLRKKLAEFGVPLRTFDQVPLIHPDDLPFPVANLPDVFTPFRKRVEQLPHLGRAPLHVPERFKPFPPPPATSPYPGYGSASLPSQNCLEWVLPHLLKPLEDTFQLQALDSGKSAFPFKGGESSALQRVEWYFRGAAAEAEAKGEEPPVQRYKETRNGLLGHAYSTKLSPFLCLGMISPREVIAAIDDFEKQFGHHQSAYWLRFELLWREYFLFISRKYGTTLFTLGGFEALTDPKQAAPKLRPGWWNTWDRSAPRAESVEKEQAAIKWMRGETGVPFIDANIAELRGSGFMSNRGRQNVASFLTKDLQIDWRIGAEFFESHLIDFEPSSNWGNWQYVAGVGNDPRASRQFNPVKQGNEYDPYGHYIRTWLPSLTEVPNPKIHCPWTLPLEDFNRFIAPGTYPTHPVIEQPGWKPHYTKRGPIKHGVANRSEIKVVLRGGKAVGAGAGGSGTGSPHGRGHGQGQGGSRTNGGGRKGCSSQGVQTDSAESGDSGPRNGSRGGDVRGKESHGQRNGQRNGHGHGHGHGHGPGHGVNGNAEEKPQRGEGGKDNDSA
ncbi:hypothetical protein JCM11641_006247 [Rhodosporidiobolus odoratus]